MGIGMAVVVDRGLGSRTADLGCLEIGSVVPVSGGDERVVFTGSWR